MFTCLFSQVLVFVNWRLNHNLKRKGIGQTPHPLITASPVWDCLGEMEILHGHLSVVEVKAKTDVQALKLERAFFEVPSPAA